MNTFHQQLCAWSGIAFVVLFGVALLLLARFVPPPSPMDSAADIAQLYAEHSVGIIAGAMLSMSASGLYVLWSALIGVLMLRMQPASPVLAYAQMLAGSTIIFIVAIPCMLWVTASFRADRSPEVIYAINDFAFLIFIGIFSTACIQYLTFGLAILADRSAPPLFPRWMGYFSLWVASTTLPASIMPFFKSGPFAWDGLLSFWLVATTFFLWIVIPFPYVLKLSGHRA